MSEYKLEDEYKLEIVENRLKQLLSGKYDLELNMETARKSEKWDAVDKLSEELKDFKVAIEIHQQERARLLANHDHDTKDS